MEKFLSLLKQKRNSGSSLTTVIVVCAFMSILGTIMLYISGANFKMKVADYSTKKSFYEAEEVVELFESQLIEDVSKASESAYKLTGSRYIELGSSESRQGLYYDFFGDELKKTWENHWTDSTNNLTGNALIVKGIEELFPATSYIGSDGSSVIVTNGAKNIKCENGKVTFDITLNGQTLYCVINSAATSGDYTYLKNNNMFRYIQALDSDYNGLAEDGVTVTSYQIVKLDITVTNANNYTSRIVTNFKITPPEINWSDKFALSNNVKEVDFTQTVCYASWSKE